MIEELKLSVLLRGATFSPSQAEQSTGLTLSNTLEVGDTVLRGPLRGQPAPYGSGHLDVPDTIPYGARLMWLVEQLERHLSTFYALGANPTRIYAGYFYTHQCNFGFNPEELQAVAALGMDFDISCYDVTN